MKLLVSTILILFSFMLNAQTFKGVLLDKATKEAVFNAVVENTVSKKKVRTNVKGKFEIEAKVGDKLYINHADIDSIVFTIKKIHSNYQKIIVKSNIKNVVGIEVIADPYEDFGIGSMRPILKDQLVYGTNLDLKLVSTPGAKSTGNARELFAKVPGLNIWESDGAGIQVGVGGRGLSPNRTANFNTRQNGYDISADALGYPESYYTPPVEALEGIQITRGSASLQFGTQFGGLLNFKIKPANENVKADYTLRATMGGYNYAGIFNRVSGALNKRFFYQAYHQFKNGDGYRDNSAFGQHQGFLQLGYHINENITWIAEYTKMTYTAQQAGGLTDAQFKVNPRQSNRDRNWFNVDWNLLATHFDWEMRNKAHVNVRAWGMNSTRNSLGFLGKINQIDIGGNRQLIKGTFKNGGVEARYLKKYGVERKENVHNGAFLIGARYYRGVTSSKQGLASDSSDADFNFLNPNEVENSSFLFPSQNVALFLDNVFLINNWTLNAGVRYDYITSATEGYYFKYNLHPILGDTLDKFKIQDARTTPRTVVLGGLGASYRFKNKSKIYLNGSQNYRAINFNDIRINNPNIIIDSAIRDEYGATIEIGMRGLVKNYFYYDVAGFYIFYGDKIGLATEGLKQKRTNIGNAVNYGLEAVAEFNFLKFLDDSSRYDLSLFGNLAYIHAKYITSIDPAIRGNQVEYVAPVILRGGLKWKSKRWNVQISGNYTSAQFTDATNAIEPSGDAVIGQIPAFFVGDLSVKYKFSDRFQLEGGANNFTNAQYFTRRATAYPGPGIIPSNGISLYLGLQLNLKTKK